MAKVMDIAREVGATKSAVLRAVKALGYKPGDGHVTVAGRGAWDLDAEAASAVADELSRRDTGHADADGGEALAAVVEVLRAQLDRADERERRHEDAHRAEVATLRGEADRLREEVAGLRRQLDEANATIQAMAGRSWLDRLLGRGLPAARR